MGQQQIPRVGDDVTSLMPEIGADVTALMSSHEPEAAPAEHPHARTARLVKENAPAIGGAIGAYLTGGASLPISALAAGAGGVVGSGLRGDDLGTMAKEGAIQGATEGIGGLALKGGRAVAHGLMRSTVPKNAKDFGDVDIAGTMLDRGVVPGSARSARRVDGLSRIANAERDAAAATVPNMPRGKVIEGLRPLHAKGVAGRVPEMSDAVLEQMRKSAREIGPDGLDGPSVLARKDIKQAQGNAAVNSSDPRTAAFGSQLADAERGALVSHLRETPRMAEGLNNSQSMMAIRKVMDDAAHSNPISRMRIGGLTSGLLSPLGIGATAHVANQGRKALDPNVIRALMALMNDRSEQ
jgi:hypothetical protein